MRCPVSRCVRSRLLLALLIRVALAATADVPCECIIEITVLVLVVLVLLLARSTSCTGNHFCLPMQLAFGERCEFTAAQRGFGAQALVKSRKVPAYAVAVLEIGLASGCTDCQCEPGPRQPSPACVPHSPPPPAPPSSSRAQSLLSAARWQAGPGEEAPSRGSSRCELRGGARPWGAKRHDSSLGRAAAEHGLCQRRLLLALLLACSPSPLSAPRGGLSTRTPQPPFQVRRWCESGGGRGGRGP